jgi:hypothetical protein
VNPTDLLGGWHLSRRLRDRMSGVAGTVTGALLLTSEADEIVWREQGVLTVAAATYDVTRTYRLRDTADGWWVHFEDGRPFHPWLPGHWVRHPCSADLYDGLVRLDSREAWRVLWRVSGPSKDQTILTRLARKV